VAGDDHAEVAGGGPRRLTEIRSRTGAAIEESGVFQIAQRAGYGGPREAKRRTSGLRSQPPPGVVSADRISSFSASKIADVLQTGAAVAGRVGRVSDLS
jgi:hypothetical protein